MLETFFKMAELLKDCQLSEAGKLFKTEICPTIPTKIVVNKEGETEIGASGKADFVFLNMLMMFRGGEVPDQYACACALMCNDILFQKELKTNEEYLQEAAETVNSN